MQDSIIAGNGNSRYLKSVSNFMNLYPAYADFVAALVDGTLPIDLNGINAAGWTQIGTALSKATLLDDTTAAALASAIGMTIPTTVSEALAGLAVTPVKIATGYRNGTGTFGSSNQSTLTFSFAPKIIILTYIDSRESSIPKRDAHMDILMDAITTSYVNTLLPSLDGYSAPSTWSKKSADGKTFYWYNTASAMGQFNATGDKVYYLAIG